MLGSLLGTAAATVGFVLLAASCTGSHDAICETVPLITVAAGLQLVLSSGGGVIAYEDSSD